VFDNTKKALIVGNDAQTQAIVNRKIAAAVVSAAAVKLSVDGSAGTTHALDYSAGQYQQLTFTGTASHTISVANWPATGTMGMLFLEFNNAGVIPSFTFPLNLKWVLSTGATSVLFSDTGVVLTTGGKDFLMWWTIDGGANIYGRVMR
jgi:hypothetical protein